MKLYLHSRWNPGSAYEVLSFDKVAHVAVLRGVNGIMTDPNFHIEIIKLIFNLTVDEPDCLKGKP